MKFVDIILSIGLMPRSGKHMLQINKQLQHKSYDKIINKPYISKHYKVSMTTIVKSYFWASKILQKCSCLPRSIAIYQHLNSLGFKVEHKFGVNKNNQNLAAHAWVEYKNKPLNEALNLKDKFKIMMK